MGGRCVTDSDTQFHVLAGGSFVLGVAWICAFAPRVRRLQALPLDAWRVSSGGKGSHPR